MFPPMTQDPVVALVQRTRSLGVVSVTVTPKPAPGWLPDTLRDQGYYVRKKVEQGKVFGEAHAR